MFAHLLYLLLMWAGAAIGGWIEAEFSGAGEVVTEWTAGEFDVWLYHALIASGAIAAFRLRRRGGSVGPDDAALGQWAPLFVKRAWNFKLLGPFSATRRGADPAWRPARESAVSPSRGRITSRF